MQSTALRSENLSRGSWPGRWNCVGDFDVDFSLPRHVAKWVVPEKVPTQRDKRAMGPKTNFMTCIRSSRGPYCSHATWRSRLGSTCSPSGTALAKQRYAEKWRRPRSTRSIVARRWFLDKITTTCAFWDSAVHDSPSRISAYADTHRTPAYLPDFNSRIVGTIRTRACVIHQRPDPRGYWKTNAYDDIRFDTKEKHRRALWIDEMIGRACGGLVGSFII